MSATKDKKFTLEELESAITYTHLAQRLLKDRLNPNFFTKEQVGRVIKNLENYIILGRIAPLNYTVAELMREYLEKFGFFDYRELVKELSMNQSEARGLIKMRL